MICLDTSLLIDLLNRKETAIKALTSLKETPICTTRINIFEVMIGIFLWEGKQRQQFLEEIRPLLQSMTLLDLDEFASIEAAKIKADLMKKGRPVEVTDCLIAGCMLAHGCTSILTADKEHYERIPEISIISY